MAGFTGVGLGVCASAAKLVPKTKIIATKNPVIERGNELNIDYAPQKNLIGEFANWRRGLRANREPQVIAYYVSKLYAVSKSLTNARLTLHLSGIIFEILQAQPSSVNAIIQLPRLTCVIVNY